MQAPDAVGQQKRADPHAQLRRLLDRANHQARRLTRIVTDLVDMSRIQTDKLELRAERCMLTQIVQEAIEEQRVTHPERTIRFSSSPRETPVVADADRIAQVVTNYLTNALKYSRSDQPVEVRIEQADGVERVVVRDHGPGLPQDQLEHIWERFYRTPDSTVQSGSGVGLGLGLYISKTIIERHGGHVGVESKVGQGSTFWFTLPRMDASEPQEMASLL